jgi:Lipocalin-like domain
VFLISAQGWIASSAEASGEALWLIFWNRANVVACSKIGGRRNGMNWPIKAAARVLLVTAILAGGTPFGISDVWAQEKGSTLAQQIQGTWILVSIYNEQDGKKTEQLGPNPRGLLIYTADGHFSHIIMRASLPKFASNSRVKGTVEENNAVVQGSIAYFGTYTVAIEKEETVVTLHIEGSTFPNWDGQDQKRFCLVVGDEMKVTNPIATIGGTNYNVWKRAK